jgi:cobalamin biosynthesis protein CobD/CbiB
MLFDPLALLLAIPLELLVLGGIAMWRPVELRLARVYERLDKPERGRRTLLVRGGVIAVAGLLIGGGIGVALQYVAWASPYRLLVETVGIALALRSGSTARTVFAAALDADYQANRQRVAVVARGLVDGLIAPACCFLAGGLGGAIAYRTVSVVAGAATGRLTIARMPRQLLRLALIVPSLIGALLLVVAAIFVPRGNPLDALRFAVLPGAAARGIGAGRTIAAASGALGIVVEGDGGWLGPANGRARIAAADVARVGLLCGVAGVILLAVVIVLVVIAL